jgi:hypothetical protein
VIEHAVAEVSNCWRSCDSGGVCLCIVLSGQGLLLRLRLPARSARGKVVSGVISRCQLPQITNTHQVDRQSLQSPYVRSLCPVGTKQRSLCGLLQPQEQILFGNSELRFGLQGRHRSRCCHTNCQDQRSARVLVLVADLQVQPEAFKQALEGWKMQDVRKWADSFGIPLQ